MFGALTNVIRRTLQPSAGARFSGNPEARKRSVAVLETLFFDVCRELAPNLFIEAGAKDAGASRRIREHLPGARIVAFEANPFTFRRFSKSIDYPAHGVEYIHRALGDREGTITFNIRVVDGRMSADGQGSMLVSTRSEVGTKPVEVMSGRIDSFFPPDSFGRCAIWVDVEGASREVLKGASGILQKVDAMFVEVEDRETWKGQWLGQDVRDFLLEHDIIAVGRDFQSHHQNNVVFVRRSALDNQRIRTLAESLPPQARL